jgi:hypothetical protein
VELRSTEALGRELRLTDKLINGKIIVDQGVIAGCAAVCMTI